MSKPYSLVFRDIDTGERLKPCLLRSAARDLDREAQALAESYRVPGSLHWECDRARKDHDRYRTTAKSLRRWARLLAILVLATSASALDWSAYDKQLHATASGLGAYVLSDVLDVTTDLPPWARFVIAGTTLTAASWAYEEFNGSSGAYREANDAHAGTVGAWLGAGAHLGVSLVLTPDRQALGLSWSY